MNRIICVVICFIIILFAQSESAKLEILDFQRPFEGIGQDLIEDFFKGKKIFQQSWIPSDQNFPNLPFSGLGPSYSQSSCISCHLNNGRGFPANINNPVSVMIIEIRSKKGKLRSQYGSTLESNGVGSILPEAVAYFNYVEFEYNYSDGNIVKLRKPKLIVNKLSDGPINSSFILSARIPPSVFGMGLINSISDYTTKPGEYYIGKFGWKGETSSLNLFVAKALYNDMGITSSLSIGFENSMIDSKIHTEITDINFDLLSRYLFLLAPPKKREILNSSEQVGKTLFTNIGCNTCHIPVLSVKPPKGFETFMGSKAELYSDLKRHDLGKGLSDISIDSSWTDPFWRTAPLWGIGLLESVNGYIFLLHDGRARTIEEAIVWHGGEAENSRNRFTKLSYIERSNLIKFIKTL